MAACRDPARLPVDYKGEIRVGDLRDPDYLDRLLAGIDIICHCAGWTSFLNNVQMSSALYLEPTIELFNRAIEWRISRFVNLSTVAVAPVSRRHDAQCPGKPRRNNAMINCMIAVEDYLRQNSQRGCSVINLRAGVYSGRRLQRGVLPLVAALGGLPWVHGRWGYLPLVDGRDLAQAFARAALAPVEAAFSSINIIGPEIPTQQQLHTFLREHGGAAASIGLPACLFTPMAHLLNLIPKLFRQPLLTPALAHMLLNPAMDNRNAFEVLGYDPRISWQASVLDWLGERNMHPDRHSLLQAETRPMNIS